MASSAAELSQGFERSLRLEEANDPSLLIRSASAPPTRENSLGESNAGRDTEFVHSAAAKQPAPESHEPQGQAPPMPQIPEQQMPPQGPTLYAYSPVMHPMSVNVASLSASPGFFDVTSSPFMGPAASVYAAAPTQYTASPGLGSYTPNLLPQSLLGTPPTFVPQSAQQQQQQQQEQHHLQQQQEAYAAHLTYSPAMGPAYYIGQQQGAPGQWVMAQPPPLQMPMMQQLPPAAMGQQASSPDSARYLRSERSPPMAQDEANEWVPESLHGSMLHGSLDHGSSQAHGGSGVPKKNTLLEELRLKMKQNPNGGGGGGSRADMNGVGRGGGGGGYYEQHPHPHHNQMHHHHHPHPGHHHPGHHHHQSGMGQAQHQGVPHMHGNYYPNPSPTGRGGHPRGMLGHKGGKSPTNGVAWGLRAILGQVCEFAKDQHGSRFIQQQLESPSVAVEDKQALFEEVLPFAHMLCTDVFGNYVIQKLLDPLVGTPEQQEQLCQAALEGNMLELSMHMYGCRVVQKLVEKVFGEEGNDLRQHFATQLQGMPGTTLYNTAYQDALLYELSGAIIQCVQDQNGNHVIQKCIEQVRPIERISFILDAFKGNIVSMARHPYGCRVVQRILENAENVSEPLAELIAEIDVLVVDQFANYVVQHVIEARHQRRDSAERKRVLKAVQDNVLAYSTHKFASNVVEKCLQYGDAKERRQLIEKMLARPPGEGRRGCPLVPMMKDPYANYVVQKVIDRAEADQRDRVVQLVRENAQALKRLTYGKHILARLDKLGNNHDGGGGGNGYGGKRRS